MKRTRPPPNRGTTFPVKMGGVKRETAEGGKRNEVKRSPKGLWLVVPKERRKEFGMCSRQDFDNLTKNLPFFSVEDYGLPAHATPIYQDFPDGCIRTYYLYLSAVYFEIWRIIE